MENKIHMGCGCMYLACTRTNRLVIHLGFGVQGLGSRVIGLFRIQVRDVYNEVGFVLTRSASRETEAPRVLLVVGCSLIETCTLSKRK